MEVIYYEKWARHMTVNITFTLLSTVPFFHMFIGS